MNKTEFAKVIAGREGVSEKEARTAVDMVTTNIVDVLRSGENIQLIGFGTFEVKHRAARTGVNPVTGDALEIPATDVPVFKAGKPFKEAIKTAYSGD